MMYTPEIHNILALGILAVSNECTKVQNPPCYAIVDRLVNGNSQNATYASPLSSASGSIDDTFPG